MPAVTHEIATYKYEYRRTRHGAVGVIWLSSAERLVAAVACVEGDGPLPPPHQGLGGTVSLTLRAAAMPGLVDMLRNERPVFFTWSPETRFTTIGTAAEPVGEAELALAASRPRRKARPPARRTKGRAAARR
jgi:hypothetical protein